MHYLVLGDSLSLLLSVSLLIGYFRTKFLVLQRPTVAMGRKGLLAAFPAGRKRRPWKPLSLLTLAKAGSLSKTPSLVSDAPAKSCGNCHRQQHSLLSSRDATMLLRTAESHAFLFPCTS